MQYFYFMHGTYALQAVKTRFIVQDYVLTVICSSALYVATSIPADANIARTKHLNSYACLYKACKN